MKYQRILTYLALYNAILTDEIYMDQIMETEAFHVQQLIQRFFLMIGREIRDHPFQ